MGIRKDMGDLVAQITDLTTENVDLTSMNSDLMEQVVGLTAQLETANVALAAATEQVKKNKDNIATVTASVTKLQTASVVPVRVT